MRTPERPFDGEGSDDSGTPSYDWLDEWLCEYVDGTMDPSLEAVFEQYVEANPELKAHVKRLRQTRELLCGCDLPKEPSTEAQAEVCTEVEKDLIQSSSAVSELSENRRLAALGLASSVAVALVVGFLAGSMLVDPIRHVPDRTAPTAEQREPVPQDFAPGYEARRPVFQFDASLFPRQERVSRTPVRSPDSEQDTSLRQSTFSTVNAR